MDLPADFDTAVLGGALDPRAEQALALAGRLGLADPDGAAAALALAQQHAPAHPAVPIARYRHHFYGHRLREARAEAVTGLAMAAQALGLPGDWRAVPAMPLPDARTGVRSRFYLFLLKGYAYLSLRLGELDEAGDALRLLRALDPGDCVGGTLLETLRLRALSGAGPYPEYEEA